MEQLLTSNTAALQILMTDDLFLVSDPVSGTTPDQVQDMQHNEEVSQVSFSYLGENNKYFLILVNDEQHTHINKIHQELLLKIIQAKGLELRDVAILNLYKYPGVSFKMVKDFFVPARIVLFGIDPQLIGLPVIQANEPRQIDGTKVLATYAIEEMQNDVEKKRSFWNTLKPF